VKRIAIVVQRCHADVAGGSEALAWHYAELLRERCNVEILTSCALDYRSWDNALPAGSEQRDGITIRRFPSAWPRGSWFGDLHRRLLQAHALHVEQRGETEIPWRAQLAEQFVRAQGPWCPGLLDHLHAHQASYDAVLFCTYLYPTTYFALECVPAHKRVLIPTLHDEPPAYLAIYARAARRAAQIVWLTDAERRLGQRLWQLDRGAVVGMAVPAQAAAAAARERPYLLYCGRIDESKGCRELIAAFRELHARRRGAVELVLTGADHLGLRTGDGVQFLGFVDEAHKRSLMAGAQAFVMPSRWESFSIVTLEALAQGTPVVVNGACEVLADHVTAARAGWSYRSGEELQRCLAAALDLPAPQRAVMAQTARTYVGACFGHAAVAQRLFAAIGLDDPHGAQ
jgi:glycosyltransferase involved in cell wall biosynthesis